MVQGTTRLTLLLAALVFVLSVGATRLVLGHARRRWIDWPGARSSHRVPTPTGGGLGALAAYAVVALAAALAGAVPDRELVLVTLGCIVPLAAIGLLDDVYDLPRSLRYSVHLAAGTFIVLWYGPLHFEPIHMPQVVWIALDVIAFTYVLNAYNFMDGIDGLVGTTGVAQLLFLAYWTHDGVAAWLVCAYGGFVVWNWPPAKIFMGDVGSTTLGALIATLLLVHSDRLALAHGLVWLPLLGDSAYTIVRRLILRQNILRAHHSHIYQRLLRAGHPHRPITVGYVVFTIVLGVLGTRGGAAATGLGIGLFAAAVVACEVYLHRRGVPFARPQPAVSPTPEVRA